jgi:hypothetical protein
MNKENFINLVSVGVIQLPNGTFCPAAAPFEALSQADVTPKVLSAFMVSLIECIIDMLPENEQISFEEETLKEFKKLVKSRADHTEKIKLTDE